MGPFSDTLLGVRTRARRVAARTWPLWAALALYLVLRSQSGAFAPSDAPSYYQFSIDPALVARNMIEYADRAGTTAAAIMLVLLAATGWPRVRVALTPAERHTAVLAGIWIPASYALTVFLPVRSSLYALLPSVGSALLVAAVASATSRANPVRFRRAAVALLALAAMLVPVYWARNDRWTDAADLSARVMELVRTAVSRDANGHVVLIDNPDAPVTFDAAFSSGFPAAVQLFAGPGWSGEIRSAGSDARPEEASLVIGLHDEEPVILQSPPASQ